MAFKRWIILGIFLACAVPLFCLGPGDDSTRGWDEPGSKDPTENWGQLKSFALVHVIGKIKEYTSKNIASFVSFAMWLFGIFITIELMKEAISMAQGGGFKLPNKIINWFIIIVFIVAMSGTICNGVFGAAMSFSEATFDRFEIVINNYFENCSLSEQSTSVLSALWNTVAHPFKMTLQGVAIGMAVLIGGLSIVLIYVMILGVFGTLGILLLIGPVAVAFMAIDIFKDAGIRWFNAILSNLIMLIFYGILLGMIGEVLSVSLQKATQSMTYASLAANIIIIIIGPLIALSLIFQGPKTVIQILGGVGSSSATWMATATTALAAMGARKFMAMGKKGGGGGEKGGGGGSGGQSEGGKSGRSGKEEGSSGGVRGGGNGGKNGSSRNVEGASENGQTKTENNTDSEQKGNKSNNTNPPESKDGNTPKDEKGESPKGDASKEDHSKEPMTKGQQLRSMASQDLKTVGKGAWKGIKNGVNKAVPNLVGTPVRGAWNLGKGTVKGAAKAVGRAIEYGKVAFADGANPKPKKGKEGKDEPRK